MTAAAKKKLLPVDLGELQARLESLPGSHRNDFSSKKWVFSVSNDVEQIIDFSRLSIIEESYRNWFISLDFDLIYVSKIIWLTCAEGGGVGGYQNRFAGIVLFWMALASINATDLSEENLAEVLAYILTHRWKGDRLSRRIKIPPTRTFRTQWPLELWRSGLRSVGLSLISPRLSYATIRKVFVTLIPKLTGDSLTYADWEKGGSFNSLTLDHGQYYVEHCLTFFEENFALASALQSVYSLISDMASDIHIHRTNLLRWVRCFLQGGMVEDLVGTGGFNWVKSRKVYQLVVSQFEATYRKSRFLSEIMKYEILRTFAKRLGLKADLSDIDRLRMVVFLWLENSSIEETTALLRGFNAPVNFSDFEKELRKLHKKSFMASCNIPALEKYRDLGVEYPLELVRLVGSAGLTGVVALTGWRRSEFGFPASAIRMFPNQDKLDQYAFPIRFEIVWFVSKTHGDVSVPREITFGIAWLVRRLQHLNGTSANMPCLYLCRKDRTQSDAFDSRDAVRTAVSAVWGHFVHHYPPFQKLDRLNHRQTGSDNEPILGSSAVTHQVPALISSIDAVNELRINANVWEAWSRCRRDWPVVDFLRCSENAIDRQNWLVKYRDGSLRKEWIEVIDSNLSEDMRCKLTELDEVACKSPDIVYAFSQDLGSDVLCPTPHAFRHMWVEGVYRRFDGDVGWLVRSSFQHISRIMWLSYVRDKDNRSMHQWVKIQVITSLVENYLTHCGEGYTGQFSIWLRRLMRKTKVMAPEEQEEFARYLSSVEIVDIKASPWGYCLLKRRTMAKAQCAESRQPQRHNASPDLCLGCVHNFMQSSNVEWMLLHAQTHIEALRSERTPAIFKRTSFRMLNNLSKHIRILDNKHEALEELNEVLEVYKTEALRDDNEIY